MINRSQFSFERIQKQKQQEQDHQALIPLKEGAIKMSSLITKCKNSKHKLSKKILISTMADPIEMLKTTPLNQEQFEKAVKQIVFDLGVPEEKARAFAEEAHDKLLNDADAVVTRELVVVKADTIHLDDEDVPAELVERTHENTPWIDVGKIVSYVKEKVQKSHQ
jgi:hypothetical protein